MLAYADDILAKNIWNLRGGKLVDEDDWKSTITRLNTNRKETSSSKGNIKIRMYIIEEVKWSKYLSYHRNQRCYEIMQRIHVGHRAYRNVSYS